jgi:hypothetical protein
MNMEAWELDFEWLRVRTLVQERFKRDALPDLNGMLFLIGIQELGRWQTSLTKEEKQDLMHIAVCKVLSYAGFYALDFVDQEGWPHWKLVKELPHFDLLEQEKLLKLQVLEYFEKEYQLEI